MKTGDLVRFRWAPLKSALRAHNKWMIGLVVDTPNEHDIATIMYDNHLYRIHTEQIQRFGKRYRIN
jgi:hypothetical protein